MRDLNVGRDQFSVSPQPALRCVALESRSKSRYAMFCLRQAWASVRPDMPAPMIRSGWLIVEMADVVE